MADGDTGANGVDATVRQARLADAEAVAAFTADTWADRAGDYLPQVFEHWVETDGPRQRTLVAEIDGDVAGVVQGVLLSEHEAWAQGMRVDPAVRGRGLSVALTEAVFDWAADAGATVCRNMVFSWNAAGLGLSRAAGFEPVTEFRWAHPEPDAEAAPPDGFSVVADPDAAWTCWTSAAGARHHRGLALDPEESWALSELTRERLRAAADDRAVFAIQDDDGTRGMAVRTRVSERETEAGETETWVEYGAAAWADVPAARALWAAIARDADDLDADRTRVLIPETPRHVSDAAYTRAGVSDEPDFVFAADLTARRG